jgi:5'-nucleotidase
MSKSALAPESSKLVLAISSRALFDLNESHQVYMEQGVQAYADYQIAHENEPLKAGEAFDLVTKMLRINDLLKEQAVEVILLSRNSADTGLRIFNSIEHYGLNISRAAFSGGGNPWRYVRPFDCDLFLSMHAEDVANALDQGVAAATLITRGPQQKKSSEEIHFAFDGDAVLFSDESERIFKEQGLEAFTKNEKKAANQPLSGGPFRNFLGSLQRLQSRFEPGECPLRTALVTARAAPAHERVIRTLRDWNIRIDESLFLGGLAKGEFLRAYGADVFFDDQMSHVESAKEHVATGHVPHGIANS